MSKQSNDEQFLKKSSVYLHSFNFLQAAPLEQPFHSDFPVLVHSGQFRIHAPWSYVTTESDYYLLLHTTAGKGKIRINEMIYSLESNSILFISIKQAYRLDAITSDWTFQALFFTGNWIRQYTISAASQFTHCILSKEKKIPYYIDKIMTPLYSDSVSVSVSVGTNLLNIMEIICNSYRNQATVNKYIPIYIQDIHKCFTENYAEHYTLEQLEQQYGINKYRICKEFKNIYAVPPFTYLNHVRIDAAQKLLETTSLKIHEIGTMVGIENTNHFISLFKRHTSMTPAAYRTCQTGFVNAES